VSHSFSTQIPIIGSETNRESQEPKTFPGFGQLTANFLYCPNQFFDVCLPNCSRGTVRLVGYLLRRTLGWLNENGEPIEQEVSVSYNDLVTKARISRGAVRAALDEASAAGFITCIQQGSAKSVGDRGQSSEYRLRFDDRIEYVKDLHDFRGFFAGEGNRTPIPNAFFDRVVVWESLAVVKIVGAVLRHTVGYQNQFGGRRTEAPLSYDYLQAFSHIVGRSALSGAITRAISHGYVTCVDRGVFDARPQCRRPATYAVRWLSHADVQMIGSKSVPVDRFKKWTSISPKNGPVDRFKKGTKEKTERKDILKQQQVHLVAAAVSLDQEDGYTLLADAGFDQVIALRLAQTATCDEIARQIEWLPRRNAQRNQLGMLRKAIEERWAEPPIAPKFKSNMLVREQDQQHNDIDVAAESQKRERLLRRDTLLVQWRQLPLSRRALFHKQAIEQAISETVRRRLRRHRDMDAPPNELLELMASESLTPRV
jgi:hypothetical protein